MVIQIHLPYPNFQCALKAVGLKNYYNIELRLKIRTKSLAVTIPWMLNQCIMSEKCILKILYLNGKVYLQTNEEIVKLLTMLNIKDDKCKWKSQTSFKKILSMHNHKSKFSGVDHSSGAWTLWKEGIAMEGSAFRERNVHHGFKIWGCYH